MKLKIIKFIQCGPCYINGPKFPKIWLFETFYITLGLVLVTFIHFIHINTKGVCDKNLGPKKVVQTFFMSLWCFFLWNKVLDCFQPNLVGIFKLVQIWRFMHKIVPCNVSIYDSNQTFNMNVLLNFNNMFKWGGSINIKWNSSFGYPNHVLTQNLKQIASCHTKLIEDGFSKDGVENICEIHLLLTPPN